MSTSYTKMLLGILGITSVFWVPTHCKGQVVLAHTYAFGDSLTRNEQLHHFFLGKSYKDYGPDPVEGMFKQLAKPGDRLHCHAQFGACSDAVLRQIKRYDEARRQGKMPAGTFFSLEAGANNLFASMNLKRISGAAPGEDVEADKIVNQIIRDIRQGVKILKQTKNATIVVWTVPDVTLTPLMKNDEYELGLSSKELQNIRLHVCRLNGEIKKLQGESRVNILDAHSLLNRLVAGETFAELFRASDKPLRSSNAVAALDARAGCCLVALSNYVRKFKQTEKPQELFADFIHPTAKVNKLVTRELVVTLRRMEKNQMLAANSATDLLVNAE